MFNLGFSELLIVGVIALIFIGPKELPEIAKVIGRMLNEFKRATGDLSSTLLDQPPPRVEPPPPQPQQSEVIEEGHKPGQEPVAVEATSEEKKS